MTQLSETLHWSGAAISHRSGITLWNSVVWEVRRTIGAMLVIVRNTQCLDGYRSLMLRRHRLRVLFMNRFFAFLTHTNKSTSSFMLFSN